MIHAAELFAETTVACVIILAIERKHNECITIYQCQIHITSKPLSGIAQHKNGLEIGWYESEINSECLDATKGTKQRRAAAPSLHIRDAEWGQVIASNVGTRNARKNARLQGCELKAKSIPAGKDWNRVASCSYVFSTPHSMVSIPKV